MNANEVQAICTTCGAGLVHVVMIKGKPYGQDCAAALLGMRSLPAWFSTGDWDSAKAKYDVDQATLNAEFESRKNSVRENWDFIKRISNAYHEARVYAYASGRDDFRVNFLSDMANRFGLQFAKEVAHQYETADQYLANNKHFDAFIIPQLSIKQKDLLDKFLNS